MEGTADFIRGVFNFEGSLIGELVIRKMLLDARHGARKAERTLLKLVRENRDTEYGRKCHFDEIKTVEDFQDRVPLSTYEDYWPYIERTAVNGEQGLLTSREIVYFATTAGTSSAEKLIPQVRSSFAPFHKYAYIQVAALVDAVRKRKVSPFLMRGLSVYDVSNRPVEHYIEGGSSIRAGMISHYAADGWKLFMPFNTPFPKEMFDATEVDDLKYLKARYSIQAPDLTWMNAAYMSALVDLMAYIQEHHDMLIHDIETGTIDQSVSLSASMRESLERKLHPDPKRAEELRAVFGSESETPFINRIWPYMSLVISIGGADFEPFTKLMRSYCCDDVQFHYSSYAASEGYIGIALRSEQPYFLLQPEYGFFEFLPVDGADELKRPLLLNELEVGKYYEIIVTNRSGLYRYQLGDVVLVTGYEGEVPYLSFAYRKKLVTNVGTARLFAGQLAAAVSGLEAATGLEVTEYSVYSDIDRRPGRVVLLLEPAGSVSDDMRQGLGKVFDLRLQSASEHYMLHRQAGDVDEAAVVLLKKNTYRAYREKKIAEGKPECQLKAVRVIDSEEKREFFFGAVDDGE